jgi:peptide/nickel transport system ATP-binding protein
MLSHGAPVRSRDPRVEARPTVEASGLRVTLHRDGQQIHALRGVDLEIGRGEIVGLVGESGSGKSILGLSLLGLLPDSAAPEVRGEIAVDGVDVLSASDATLRELRRARLGAVFQDPMTTLDPTMRIGDQMLEVADGVDDAVRLLDLVGVPEPRRRVRAYPHELSGGLRQRVMIAMAVAGNPSLIVADEPTTALDVTVQAQILELLAQLREKLECSVLFITHDLGVASELADRIVVLYAGRVAEVGPTSALLTEPRHPYSAGLLESRLDLGTDRDRPLSALEGGPPDARAPLAGCPFAPRCRFRLPICTEQVPELAGDGVHSDSCIRSGELDLAASAPSTEAARKASRKQIAEPVLVARGLSVSASRRRLVRKTRPVEILKGVDFEVAAGEAVAIVGESGSGKTTLLRSVAGLSPPDGGELELSSGPAPQMVFQDPSSSLTPWLTVGEIIEDRLRGVIPSKEMRRRRVAEALVEVGLPPDSARVRPSQLSGGQRQRVALARAVVVPPTILLCDEPTSSLDVSVAAGVLNLIDRLRRTLNMAVLFVTHDLAVARFVADRIAVMYFGRIVEIGAAEEVISRPAHPYTRVLLSSLPGRGNERVVLGGAPPSIYSPPTGCAFHPRCPHETPACRSRAPQYHAVSGEPSHLVDCILEERA